MVLPLARAEVALVAPISPQVLAEVATEEVASFFKRAVTPLAAPAAAVRPAAQVGP